MRLKKRLISLIIVLFIISCGTQLQYIKNSENTYASRRSPSQIQIFYSEPNLKYESIGIINWDYYKPGFRAPSITDVLPSLRQRASQEGGDAIIIRKQEIPPLTERNLRITADVIKFLDH